MALLITLTSGAQIFAAPSHRGLFSEPPESGFSRLVRPPCGVSWYTLCPLVQATQLVLLALIVSSILIIITLYHLLLICINFIMTNFFAGPYLLSVSKTSFHDNDVGWQCRETAKASMMHHEQ